MAEKIVRIIYKVEGAELDTALDKTKQLGKATEEDIAIYKKLSDTVSGVGKSYNEVSAKIVENKNLLASLREQAALAANEVKRVGDEAGKGTPQYQAAKIAYDDINKQIKAAVVNQDRLNAELSEAKRTTEGVKQATTGITQGIAQSVPVAKSLRTEMMEARQAAVDAARKFGEGSQEFQTAAKRAAELKAEVKDLGETLDALDPDAKGRAFNQLGTAAFGAFQIATGALQAFGVENEKVNKLAQQFQGFLNITQGISQIGQLSDALKNVSAVLGITTTAQKAATVATEADTVAKGVNAAATDAAAASTKAFTAALVTSPLIIFAAAAAAVAGAIYLIDEAVEDGAESLALLQRRLADMDAARKTFDETFATAQDERIRGIQHEIDLATAQGKSQRDLIELEIKKQQAIIETNRAANARGAGTDEGDKERVMQNQEAIRQIEVLEAQLTKFLSDEELKRRAEREKSAQAAIEAEKKRLAELKAQFESEQAKQSADIDARLNIQKTRNAADFFGKTDELRQADIAAEIQANDEKIELLKQFGMEYTREYELLLAKRNLLQKQYDETNAKQTHGAFQDFIIENQAIIQKSLTAVGEIYNQFTNLAQANTQAEIEIEQQKYDESLEGLESNLEDKRISQQQYNDSVQAIEKQRNEQIKKLQMEQAQRAKQQAIFNIALSTAQALISTLAQNPLPLGLPFLIATSAIGAAQLAAAIAQPLPKFAKGTLSVKGGTPGQDSVAAMLMPEEAVIPVRENKDYHRTVKAVYNREVPAQQLSDFINLPDKVRYNLLLSAGAVVGKSIKSVSTARILNDFTTRSVQSKSTTSIRNTPTIINTRGIEQAIRNNKSVKIQNERRLADLIAQGISDRINPRRQW